MLPAFGSRDPDDRGYFGDYGGRFVPETLVAPIEELERAYRTAGVDRAFGVQLEELLNRYVGRPTPVYIFCWRVFRVLLSGVTTLY